MMVSVSRPLKNHEFRIFGGVHVQVCGSKPGVPLL